MKSENAEGVFSNSLAFHLEIYHFTSSFPGSSLFFPSSLDKVPWLRLVKCLCIKIKSELMVGLTLNFTDCATLGSMCTSSPFPSSCLPPLQSESKCEVFVMKISFHSYVK